MKVKVCSHCGGEFSCGPETGEDGHCWCSSLPAIMPVPAEKDCLCNTCLSAVVKKRIEAFADDYKAGKVANTAPDLHTKSFHEGIDFYKEGGYMVFTEWYHLKRGYCCGSGCRHCPYKGKSK